MSKLKEGMVPYIEANEIAQMVTTLAEAIDRDYGNAPLVLMCPLKGSFMFVADLARKLKNPNVEFEFVQVKSLGNSMRLIKDISIDIYEKNVLICEEIIDAGRTLSFLKRHLQHSNPRTVRIATLIDKPVRRNPFRSR